MNKSNFKYMLWLVFCSIVGSAFGYLVAIAILSILGYV